ncbi:Hermansky-Pudlak syndrome 5 protein homolog isoform X2 [Sitophilus oryzae]|uniref:Hermansky-Pudlak syndrome 5 protein homolog isoform X2 n=1 Tax=Sitophilus oryzae TaxID=7048 RepID=A0A6J2X7U4_SITOR|nr:Hermansky-Pudlak syndrome 5 protein homolog isoform X2 [Sitophilus oryzae]
MNTKAKTIFQVPSESVMKLDSAIVQIDTYNNYLLVSTYTKTYFCDTERGCYIQLGKKLRNGAYGACFFINNRNHDSEISLQEECRIFCARPGLRLWEANTEAQVIMTYQFKESVKNKLSHNIINIDPDKKIPDKFIENNGIPDDVSFQKIFPFCSNCILTFDTSGIYILNLTENKLIFWLKFAEGIKNVIIINETIYVWKSNLEVVVFSLSNLENLILKKLYMEEYTFCAEICVKYYEKLKELLQTSQDLYLLGVLKKKISDNVLLEKLESVFEIIDEQNKKFIERNKIVEHEEPSIAQKDLIEIDNTNNKFRTLLRQYKVNKTHKNIEIPELNRVYQETSAPDDLIVLFKDFIEYSLKEINEDPNQWCDDQFMNQILKKNVVVEKLSDTSLEHLKNIVFSVNKSIKYSCSCGYPLPNCHKFTPKYYKTALDLLGLKNHKKQVFQEVPYMLRYQIKSEIHGLNLSLLIQYNDEVLFKENCKQILYDRWYDVLGYYVKLRKGLCLNCDKDINIDGLISWNDMGKIVLQSLGATSAIRILRKFEKNIPKGALDARFYQACIFANSFKIENEDVKKYVEVSVELVENLEGESYNEFQHCLEKYFNRKYNTCGDPCTKVDNKRKCTMCTLPLKNDIFECQSPKLCQHVFHSFCLKNNNAVCGICSD